MTERRISHVKVNHVDGESEITRVYAIDDDTLRLAQAWLGEQGNPTAKDMDEWLENAGCNLDSAGGPAYVQSSANGTTEEIYYRDGKRHREDGPAYICQSADGWRVEAHYLDDRFIKADRFAPLSVIPGVTVDTPAPSIPGPPGMGPA